MVVRGLERSGANQPLTARLLEHVLQLTGAIGRIDIDQDHAQFGAGELGDAPLRAVRSPNAQTVTCLQAQRHQRPRMQVYRFAQLRPAIAQLLMAHDQCLAKRTFGDSLVECLTDGLRQQRLVLPAARIARLNHGRSLFMFVLGSQPYRRFARHSHHKGLTLRTSLLWRKLTLT